LIEDKGNSLGDYGTGIVLLLEDGRLLKLLSTDIIEPYAILEHNTNSENCWCDPNIEVLHSGDKVITHKDL